MEIEKYIAALLASLMAVSTFVGAVLASDLSGFPEFLFTKTATASSPAYLVVVGADAKTSDVVGAIDLASRLAEGSYTIESVTAAAAAAVTGTEKDNVGLSSLLRDIFPNSGVMKTIHYSGLLDSEFTWRGDTYDFHEEADIANVQMRHTFAIDKVNGTEKMQIESGDVIYKYVFDEAISGTGSTTTPNYTYPIYINLMGKQFAIVGADSTGVRILKGSIGTVTDKTPVTYGDYSVYSDLGNSGNWARIIVKDKAGNTVGTKVIDQGSSWDFTDISLTVKVTTVRALTDGTIVGVDVVVGPMAEVDKVYDSSADTTSTGTASDRFPGETDWGIRVANWGATAGTISANSRIEVVYQPTETKYLSAGEKLVFPNNYAELGFEGWNTDKFATITIEPLTSTITAYNNSATTQSFPNLQGLKISTDVSGSIVGLANNAYTTAYVLFNASTGVPGNVFIGFYDSPSQKILVNGTIVSVSANGTATNEFTSVSLAGDSWIMYPFKLTYGGAGDQNYYLNVTIYANSTYASRGGLGRVAFNKAGSAATIVANYFNSTSVALFKLGGTAGSAEAGDINATAEGTVGQIGTYSQDVVDDSGMIVVAPSSYTGSDKVAVKIPAKDLNVKAYFGKLGAVTGGVTTYNKVSPIKTAVAKLDSEVTDAMKGAYHLVLVGGPCVNSLVAALKTAGKFEYGCTDWPAENFALVEVIDDAFASGKVAVVVAGTRAEDTRLACSVMQNYDAYKAQFGTSAKVKITGTIAAPSITPA